ncbi:MAG: ATP-dependent sacrificial sulfur transferase LarE [Thermodesulfobacteriota bacterium]|nr:ATP-dependent sacrificial sulfur transferase LarE [Thermodesulfobacteriota bacterium]
MRRGETVAVDIQEILCACRPLVVMFSGGLDSVLLADLAHECLRDDMLCITIDSPVVKRCELEEAAKFCAGRGIRQVVLLLDETLDACFAANPPERCYICRRLRDRAVLEWVSENPGFIVADGMNKSDLDDYRPGMKAAHEDGIRHPLIEAGMDKDSIREMARSRGISGWDRESTVGLCSRVLYGLPLTHERLQRIEEAETFLQDMGLKDIRVRCFPGERAVIETNAAGVVTVKHQRVAIAEKLQALGFIWAGDVGVKKGRTKLPT